MIWGSKKVRKYEQQRRSKNRQRKRKAKRWKQNARKVVIRWTSNQYVCGIGLKIETTQCQFEKWRDGCLKDNGRRHVPGLYNMELGTMRNSVYAAASLANWNWRAYHRFGGSKGYIFYSGMSGKPRATLCQSNLSLRYSNDLRQKILDIIQHSDKTNQIKGTAFQSELTAKGGLLAMFYVSALQARRL